MNTLKMLVAAALVSIATLLPAQAGNAVDKGVAGTMIVYALCGQELVPTRVLRMVNVYLQTRNAEVMAEAKAIVNEFSTIPNMDKETAKNMWCSLMKPKLSEIFQDFPDSF